MTILVSSPLCGVVLFAFTALLACRPLAAFVFPPRTTTTTMVSVTTSPGHQQRRAVPPLLFSSLSSIDVGNASSSRTVDNDSMSKVETVAVHRFTQGYNKLCKSCPTRIAPRVDTLTEMILGLPDEERDKLMRAVAERQRLQKEKEGQNKPEDAMMTAEKVMQVTSSRDVYEFQMAAGGAGLGVEPDYKEKNADEMHKANANGRKKPSAGRLSPADPANNNIEKQEKESEELTLIAKLLKKRDKAKKKYKDSKQNAIRVERLVAASIAMLASDDPSHAVLKESIGWYHDFDELKELSRNELRMEYLKFTAQKAKHEQKIAKQRMKLYGVNVALADARTRMRIAEQLP
mmetsp:Transcript_37865/g.81748  ORF Transcript_37865/g.81748 Transcript_37865/m.81748 type:complete len:347 (-) Transcript_37865:267-1307(-)